MRKKIEKLKSILGRMGSVVVAYSAGVDSTFLLKLACDTLGERVLAVTADSLTYPRQELAAAKKIARLIGARHQIIKTAEFKDKRFVANPKNRCYFCKKELFSKLKAVAKKHRFNFVVEASTLSDKKDFRPGALAKAELGIRSPLEEAGFSKEDVRRLSRRLCLPTWDKPAQPCLASRVPYGRALTRGVLSRIQKAEECLRRRGFREVRVRHYNGLCRIEVARKELGKLVGQARAISRELRQVGYRYITVDLEGYRQGSLNEGLKCLFRQRSAKKR
jgi:uncharacterized protein